MCLSMQTLPLPSARAWNKSGNAFRATSESQQLQAFHFDEATTKNLAADEPGNLTPAQHEAQWRAFVYYLLAQRVSPEAADTYRQRTMAPEATTATSEPAYVGVLSLVVYSRDH